MKTLDFILAPYRGCLPVRPTLATVTDIRAGQSTYYSSTLPKAS